MKGSEGIPQLKLETLNKVIHAFPKAANLFFTNMFGENKADSDTITWETEFGSAGMTPFVAPGSVAPAIGLDGVGKGSATAAFFKEKMYFDEEFLNNLRQLGTYATYETAKVKLARGLLKLRNRMDRRREWMTAQMLVNGSFSYVTKGETNVSVSYGIPTSHMVTLAADRQWDDGANRNPVEDIMDAKTVVANDAGVQLTDAYLNSELLKLLILDSKIQALLSKSAFGSGDLFSRPREVIGSLLNLNLTTYDELYEVQGWIMSAVTGGSSTTVTVDDPSDFEVGGTLRFIKVKEANVWEDETITAVNKTTGVITVATAPTLSFTAGIDKVVMRKKFIGDDTFFMMNPVANDGTKIAEILMAPYGLGRRWGYYSDKKDEWDPEGTWLRNQDKCLPVLYFPNNTFKYIVK